MLTMPHRVDDPIPDTVTLSADPDTVTLSADRAWLSATWADGRQVRLAAASLRSACRCAACVRGRADGVVIPDDTVSIVAVHAHGPHVGRLVFSDGHDRGLYPWTWLLEIADAGAATTDDRP